MTALQAALPLLGLLGAGAAVALLARRHGRKKKTRGLPTDPLCNLFVREDDRL